MRFVFDIRMKHSTIKYIGLLLSLLIIVACSGQPAEDVEDVLDSLNPTPTPTPTPVSGSSLNLIWDSSANFSSFNFDQSEVIPIGSIQSSVLVVAESGRIDITGTIDNSSFVTVNFRNTFVDPVVIAFVATLNENEPVEVRVRNVGQSSAELFLEESSGGLHGTETITYFVVEKGRFQFSDGTIIEAGLHTTASYHNGVGGSYGGDAISFSAPFPSAPAIFSSLNTYNNGDFMSSIAYGSSTAGFTLQQEAAETGNVGVAESIAWLAFSKGNSSLPLTQFEVGSASDGNNDGPDNGSPHGISMTSFTVAPDIIVKQSSANGNNGGWSRGEGTWDATTFNVYSDEDQESDGERSHTDEEFSWLALTPNSDVGGFYASSVATSPEIDLSSIIEVQSTIVTWTESIAAGTSLSIETRVSIDGGTSWSSWQNITQGGSIDGLSLGTDVSNGFLQVRALLTTANDGLTASLDSISIDIQTNIP